eukprot:GGOE01001380.1.p2 GENE.GGOE01001380.1~~GGOE01001380.1.p2  ORF type:complete len:209 (-),score=27.63 GGOE01001380.1:290-877(-)
MSEERRPGRSTGRGCSPSTERAAHHKRPLGHDDTNNIERGASSADNVLRCRPTSDVKGTPAAKRPRASRSPSPRAPRRSAGEKPVPVEASGHPRGEEAAEAKPATQTVKANKWTSVEFGTEGQKEKFLRLMGGMKKPPPQPAKPTGQTAWEDPEGPGSNVLGKAQSEALFCAMEQQYGRGMAYSANRRQGLGFGH